jgi:L-threonylcarbamoyladenylate synthase
VAEGLSLILDGGPCEVGLESTVVDCTGAVLRVLRPGRISRDQLNADLAGGGERRSPGMYRRHYSPRTPVRIVAALGAADGGIVLGDGHSPLQVKLPPDPDQYGAALYRTLHWLDGQGLGEILIESPPQEPAWEAVWDRLMKACGSG